MAHSIRMDGVDIVPEVKPDTYCIALIGEDGKVVLGSRLSGGFTSLSKAFSSLDIFKSLHPSAGVFSTASGA